MSVLLFIGIWLSGFCLGIGFGGYIGKLQERKDWNKLIDEGKIPKPK